MKGGLTRRTIVASGILALVVAAAFSVLLVSITELRGSEQRARQSDEVLVAANRLERLAVDLDSGQRGFLITGQDDVLQPWRAAQLAFPAQASTLEGLVGDDPEQQRRAQAIAQSFASYIQEYSIPLVDLARRDPAAARTTAELAEDRRRIDAIRTEFDGFIGTEHGLAKALASHSEAMTRRGFIAAGVGLVGSVLLIGLFGVYLTGSIVRPLHRAAAMAGRLAGGDLGARLPERGAGEIGILQRSFNTMACSLQGSREELAASRARLVAAADQARRRIERDLHDGTQQRLVSLALALRVAESTTPPELTSLRAQLADVVDGLTGATDELRELSHGIHPAILSEGGLPPALRALARRSAIPVELDVDVPERLPDWVEVAAYYLVSEALTNTAKHAKASVARVAAQARDGNLHLSILDDGIGGAALGRGSGLTGLTDRAQAVGGTITITSPVGQGTSVVVDLPFGTR